MRLRSTRTAHTCPIYGVPVGVPFRSQNHFGPCRSVTVRDRRFARKPYQIRKWRTNSIQYLRLSRRRPRLQNVSTTRVDSRGFGWTAVSESELWCPAPSEPLRVECGSSVT
jgi:hypothetical protein